MSGVRARTQNATDLDTAQHGQVEVEDDEIGRVVGHRFERSVAAAHDFRLGLSGPLQRPLDQTGDVVLVFDDKDAISGHESKKTIPVTGFAAVSGLLNVGYEIVVSGCAGSHDLGRIF